MASKYQTDETLMSIDPQDAKLLASMALFSV